MALKVSHRMQLDAHLHALLGATYVLRKSRPHCRKCIIVWLSILLLHCRSAVGQFSWALLWSCRDANGPQGTGALAPQAERTLLYTLGFRLHFDHPHHLVPRLAKDYDVERHFSASSKTPGGHTFTLSQVLLPLTSKPLRIWS